MVLDFLLAHVCSGAASCDFLTREVSEGAAFVFNSAVGVAFLGGLCRARVAPAAARCLNSYTVLDHGEALSAKRVPQNIARWQPDRRDEVVFDRGLFACRETRDVRSRVSAVLFARPRIHCGLAKPHVAAAADHSRRAAWSAGCRAV